MTADATRSPEEQDHLWSVLFSLQPMGGHTLYDEDGQAIGSACGEHNVPPWVPGIRGALQEAAEAEIDPKALYRRAVVIYEELDAERRREEPLWTWPAPPFEAVEPLTWPPLEPDYRAIHQVRASGALCDHEAEPRRIERLRRVLARAQARGLDPEALYRDAVALYVDGKIDIDRQRAGHHVHRPAPSYEDVRPA